MGMLNEVAQSMGPGLCYCDLLSVEAYFWFCLKKKSHTVMWRRNICIVYLYFCVHNFSVNYIFFLFL